MGTESRRVAAGSASIKKGQRLATCHHTPLDKLEARALLATANAIPPPRQGLDAPVEVSVTHFNVGAEAMLAQVLSGAVLGVDAYLVRVEADIANGLPSMTVVGLPESSVKEGRDRITAALANVGLAIPPRRITINLAPADEPKHGSAFDLPVALAVLAANGVFDPAALAGVCLTGELGLDGEVRPVRGVLSLAVCCRAAGIASFIVPAANAREASIVDGLDVRRARTLSDVVRHFRGEAALDRPPAVVETHEPSHDGHLDFADVKGHAHARRALEIAAAGQHNALLIGPPGSGKSMLARRLPGILPPLTREEAIEVTRIASVAGRLRPGGGLVTTRPFRAPHHTVSDAGLVGGGGIPRPGEVSLAHRGVLFMDELPEFRRHVLEALRQPIEEGSVHLGRSRQSITYPARFTLIAAMNPCPCGFFGSGSARCICHAGAVQRYRSRVSGPLLDRIDLHVDVPALDERHLTAGGVAESSASMRARVIEATERQLRRFRACDDIFANAQMGPREIREHCGLEPAGDALLQAAIRRIGLSARAYHRVLRLARTIADLAGHDRIRTEHVAESIQYRSLDRLTAASR